MTEEEIDKMEAGEIMDDLVAEKIMGAVSKKYESQGEGYGYKLRDGRMLRNWSPSIRMGDAWLVVDKLLPLTPDGDNFELAYLPDNEGWQVGFFIQDRKRGGLILL